MNNKYKFVLFVFLFALTLTLSSNTVYAGQATGVLDTNASGTNSCTSLSGWAWDPDFPNDATTVHVYDNGAFHSVINASTFRGDLPGNQFHGFGMMIPSAWKDGANHTINLYAIDLNGEGNPNLIFSPAQIYCPPSAPTLTSLTINNNIIKPDGVTKYNIDLSASDSSGAANIQYMYALVNYQGENAGNHAGYLTWAYAANPWPGAKDVTVCTGAGGTAVIQPGVYGAEKMELHSCNVVDNGNSRSITYTVSFNPSFISTTTNDISGYAYNKNNLAVGWTNFQTNFNLAPRVAPTVNLTLSSNSVRADNVTKYDIIVAGTNPAGAADITWQEALINYQGGNVGTFRGFLVYNPVPGAYFSSNAYTDIRTCSGIGGEAGVYPGTSYGSQYIHLDSCATTDSGNTRTTKFTVRFDTAFTSPLTGNDISAYTHDGPSGLNSGWVNFDTNFSLTTEPVVVPPPDTTPVFLGTMKCIGSSGVSVGTGSTSACEVNLGQSAILSWDQSMLANPPTACALFNGDTNLNVISISGSYTTPVLTQSIPVNVYNLRCFGPGGMSDTRPGLGSPAIIVLSIPVASPDGRISVPPPDTITSSDGNVTIGVSKQYGGAIVYYTDKRIPRTSQDHPSSAGNIIDYSSSGALLQSAIFILSDGLAHPHEQGLCPKSRQTGGFFSICPGSTIFHNPTQGGIGAGPNPNPLSVSITPDNHIHVSIRLVNFNDGFTPQELPFTEANRLIWQTDVWQDIDIHFHPVLKDVVVIDTKSTYCKDNNTFCAGKTMTTQDNQLSAIFVAGQRAGLEPQYQGPYVNTAFFDKKAGAFVFNKFNSPDQENWAAVVGVNNKGIGVSVANPGAGHYISNTAEPSIVMSQPSLVGFESSGVTELPEPKSTGNSAFATHATTHNFKFQPGGYYKFTSYVATGDINKIRWDLLRANEKNYLPEINGSVDVINFDHVSGWARDERNLGIPLNIRVDVYDTNGEFLFSRNGVVDGSIGRQDLNDLNICPKGACTFHVPLNLPLDKIGYNPVTIKVYGVYKQTLAGGNTSIKESLINPGNKPYTISYKPNLAPVIENFSAFHGWPGSENGYEYTLNWDVKNANSVTITETDVKFKDPSLIGKFKANALVSLLSSSALNNITLTAVNDFGASVRKISLINQTSFPFRIGLRVTNNTINHLMVSNILHPSVFDIENGPTIEIGTQPPSASGMILFTAIGGITGIQRWYYVDYDTGPDGWVKRETLGPEDLSFFPAQVQVLVGNRVSNNAPIKIKVSNASNPQSFDLNQQPNLSACSGKVISLDPITLSTVPIADGLNCTQSTGATGVVLDRKIVIGGLITWAYVDYDTGPDGWVDEGFLKPAIPPKVEDTTTSASISVTVNNVTTPPADTTLPTVSLSAPASGATVSGTSTTVSATATDNIGVSGVQFKIDGTNLGVEDTTSPYSITWDTTSATNGSHSLTAVARDAAGNSKTSNARSVTVNNITTPPADTTAPTVSITAPASGATVSGTSNTVSASASDNVGVSGVTFKVDGTTIGSEDTTSPYSVTLNTTTLTNAAHSITAVARDAAGNTTTSGTVTVTVNNVTTPPADTTAPTVSITAPAASATVSGTSTTVSATASDAVGVVGVQFKLDGANLGTEDTSSPYSKTWNTTSATNGSHTLTAVARDAAGNTTTSNSRTVTVSNVTADTTLPTVSVTAPAAGATVSGSSVSLTASASDNIGVVGVQFKVDGANRGSEDTSSPYSKTWDTTTATNGTHTITAVARDAAGNTTTSSSVTVTVNNVLDTTPPTVSVTAPASGATVSGSSVSLNATASDNIAVVGVQFKVDGANRGSEDTSAPYSKNWDTTTVANGTHTITAVARDAAGNTKTSTAVTVTVTGSTAEADSQNFLVAAAVLMGDAVIDVFDFFSSLLSF